jgi:NADP-dependent 3-hydroxy acid dehydrogenase YdfG
MNQIVLITGATSGIGKACAEKFAANGYDLIITGRREERLSIVKQEIESKNDVKILALCFDIRDKNAVIGEIENLEDEWKKIDVLVNNAGLALGLSPLQDGEFDDWETMIDTNIKGVLYMSKLVANLMIENGKGHIIHIGSIAGRDAYPNGNVYVASKHAIDGLTKSMRMDLMKHNIKVTQVAPGAVETEFSEVRFKGDRTKAKKVYEGFQPLTGDDVAEAVYFVTTLPPHANIDDLLIMPMAQASATIFNKMI